MIKGKSWRERLQDELSRMSVSERLAYEQSERRARVQFHISLPAERVHGFVAMDDRSIVFALYTPMHHTTSTTDVICGAPMIVKRVSLLATSKGENEDDTIRRVIYGCIDVFSLNAELSTATTLTEVLPSVGALLIGYTRSYTHLSSQICAQLPSSFQRISSTHLITLGGSAGIVELIRDELGVSNVPTPHETCEFSSEVFERRRHHCAITEVEKQKQKVTDKNETLINVIDETCIIV